MERSNYLGWAGYLYEENVVKFVFWTSTHLWKIKLQKKKTNFVTIKRYLNSFPIYDVKIAIGDYILHEATNENGYFLIEFSLVRTMNGTYFDRIYIPKVCVPWISPDGRTDNHSLIETERSRILNNDMTVI